ncbi:MAG TPA: VOC family protein [Streptosporangiaceae bacterium]|jgi:catechol 2,3-dioxygenase-like lactoylglutathione lyase family enzyme
MAVRSVFHVGFVVRDLDASIAFYTSGLGLRLRHRQTQDNGYTRSLVGYPDASLRIAQFQLPEGEPPESGHVLELIEYQSPEGGPADLERNTTGAGHLAFLVDDIEAMTAALAALGATPLSAPSEITEGINRGGKAVYLHDPDGVMLELLQPAAQPAGTAP